MLITHSQSCLAHQIEISDHIGIQNTLKGLGGKTPEIDPLGGICLQCHIRGVEHQGFYKEIGIVNVVENINHLLFVPKIQLVACGYDSIRFRKPPCRGFCLDTVLSADDHIPPLSGKEIGNAKAGSALTAGDENSLVHSVFLQK